MMYTWLAIQRVACFWFSAKYKSIPDFESLYQKKDTETSFRKMCVYRVSSWVWEKSLEIITKAYYATGRTGGNIIIIIKEPSLKYSAKSYNSTILYHQENNFELITQIEKTAE